MGAYVFGALRMGGEGHEFTVDGVFPLPWAYDDEYCQGPLIAHDPEQRGEDYESYAVPVETIGSAGPVCRSVAFRFEDGFKPSNKQVDEVFERVKGFPKAWDRKKHLDDSNPLIELTGLRLVRTEIEVENTDEIALTF